MYASKEHGELGRAVEVSSFLLIHLELFPHFRRSYQVVGACRVEVLLQKELLQWKEHKADIPLVSLKQACYRIYISLKGSRCSGTRTSWQSEVLRAD